MAFYVGCYQILADSQEPLHDSGPWALPDAPAQHMSDTNNVEELFLNVTDMNVLPTQIQFGSGEWEDDAGFDSDDTFTAFYVKEEFFYVRGFTASDGYLQAFYPATGFYIRSFSPTDTWTPSFYPSGAFYVRGFTGRDTWTPMFYTREAFYVRNFTPTDLWTEFYVHVC